MAKRKRENTDAASSNSKARKAAAGSKLPQAANGASTVTPAATAPERTMLQIVTGSYDRVLHGIVATIPKTTPSDSTAVEFADSFLFNAHTSAIRCLAISPPTPSVDGSSSKVILASGSTDQRINLYSLSTAPPPAESLLKLPSLTGTKVTENPKNRELGSLLHHSSTISALHFPSRSKLISAAEDNAIAISRTRDWTVLSTLKAPIPKVMGRPSGDTAAPGEVPAGVNDFAIHPSMKFMVTVGKAERCMRLWNLLTGKKAGVLNFGRDMLQQAGEGKWGTGEGRKVAWDTREDPQEFVIGFERGAVVYSMDSKPLSCIAPKPPTKLHQISYLPNNFAPNVVALSTEDGRILFYQTPQESEQSEEPTSDDNPRKPTQIPQSSFIGQLGGRAVGVTGRIKDYDIHSVLVENEAEINELLFVTGSSDGVVRIWSVKREDLLAASSQTANQVNSGNETPAADEKTEPTKQLGALLGSYETGNRITCLKSFALTGEPDKATQADEEPQEAISSDEDDSA